MDEGPLVSTWALSHFGDNAAAVRRGIVEALSESQSRAVLIQEMSGLPGKQPYGGMWPATHQALEEHLQHLPGVQRFRPPRAPYNLMVVNGRLLLPFRHADNLNVPLTNAQLMTKIAQELSTALAAAAPEADLFSLFEDEYEQVPVFASPELVHLDPTTKIIYVPYVCHADAGLIKAWWGEATMHADGTLSWYPGHPEELPSIERLSTTGTSTRLGGPRISGPARTAGGFDEGELPPLDFPTRTRQDQAPVSDPTPKNPTAQQNDE